jgi:CHAT domain-containing protein
MLHLDGARLIFLSSCGSGLGALVPSEGIVGFQRALCVAGCRAMILSLWDLPDRPTREWVERFYEHYTAADCGPAAAYGFACTETLSVRRSIGRSTHPFYWGGFAVIGVD